MLSEWTISEAVELTLGANKLKKDDKRMKWEPKIENKFNEINEDNNVSLYKGTEWQSEDYYTLQSTFTI